MYHQIMTTIIWIHIHDVIDDVTRSQNRSNFEIDISPSLFALQRRSKAQNVRYAHGYLSGILSFRYNFRQKSLSRAQNGGHFKNFEILNTASIWPQIWKYHPKLCQKKYFHDDVIDDVTGWPESRPSIFLYILIITKQRPKISSLNFLCICIMRL